MQLKQLLAGILWVLACCCIQAKQAKGQQVNSYGLKVIRDPAFLKAAGTRDSLQRMVPLHRYLHPLQTCFVYATADNFTHQVLYHQPVAYLRLAAARRLQLVQDSLQQLGLNIRLFDSYRPYHVTEKMWQIVPDERYAANPAGGSGHNRGIAVDLTLTDSNGKDLPMPTGFDHFSDSAHHDFNRLPADVLRNRQLLKNIMTHFGFRALATEWWHYSLPDARRYDLLDLDFNQLNTIDATTER